MPFIFPRAEAQWNQILSEFAKKQLTKVSFWQKVAFTLIYRKVASSNTSRLEAHAGFFRLHMKVIFDPYVLKAVLSVRKHLFDLTVTKGMLWFDKV